MSEIIRTTDPAEGPLDGVKAEIQCVITQFTKPTRRKKNPTIKQQVPMPAVVLTAYSEGTLGISVRPLSFMVTVRLDELMGIVAAAANVARELEQSTQAAPAGAGE